MSIDNQDAFGVTSVRPDLAAVTFLRTPEGFAARLPGPPPQVELAFDHFGRRRPIRRLGYLSDVLGALTGESLAADAAVVARRPAVAEEGCR